VLRPGINFYSTEYRSEAVDGFPGTVTHGDFAPGDVVDSAVVKERRLSISIGSQRSWGYFTLAGGFGLEYELRKDRRCVALTGNIYGTATAEPECRDDDVFALAREPLGGAAEPSQVNLFGGLHPFYLAARLSLGVVFDKED
jgi:hypothetical protein